MSHAAVQSLQLVHEDNRRAIYEVNGSDFSVQYFKINSEPVLKGLGNHYHRKKSEVFTILSGGGLVLLQDVNNDGQPVGEVRVQELNPRDVVTIPSFVVHTFHLRPDSEMHCYSTKPFDPNDKDMTQFELAKPEPAPEPAS